MSEPCFQLKGSVVTVVVLEIHHYADTAFAEQLDEKIRQAPQLLANSPIVINPEKCDAEVIDFTGLLQHCRDLGLQPIGFRSCPRFDAAMHETGLPVLPSVSGRGGSSGREEPAPGGQEAMAGASPAGKTGRQASRIVTQPVRSGQQVYARDADLIVTARVSEGAELLADGNIHVYGDLRGRALAGVRGDDTARIFCQSLEAELLSVAGNFLLSDNFGEELWKRPVQVFLEGDKLRLDPL